MGHCDVLRSGHPAEAAGPWHTGVIPEHSAAFLITPIRFFHNKLEIFHVETSFFFN